MDFIKVILVLQELIRGGASTCDLNAYCVKLAGSGSYCKSYLSKPVCFGSTIPCLSCSAIATTTGVPTTKLVIATSTTSTTKQVTSTTSSPTTTIKLVSTTSIASTTTVAVQASTSVITQTAMSCDTFCVQFSPGSYCKTWSAVPVCSGSNVPCDSTQCGASVNNSATTVAPTILTSSTNPTQAVTVATQSSSNQSDSDCESYSSQEVPLFVWIEGPRMYQPAEFVAFYQKVKVFLESNCAHIRPTTLAIRTAHPYYVPNYASEYWPPNTSPLFTELLSKLNVGSPVKVVLYPYVFDDFSRSQWVKFANSGSVDKVLPRVTYPATSSAATVLSSVNIYDGIFQFVKGWQLAVDSLGSNVKIDGFVIDYEEISRYPDSKYLVRFNADEINPYRALYPSIKVGTTVGYDDVKKMVTFESYVDYLFLEAYDLYYPYAGADATADSIFTTYKDNPVGLANVLSKNVFTSGILAAYQARLSKIFIMWSTQSLTVTNCLYKLNNGSCGVNNEFGSWRPDTFNQFIQAVKGTSTTMANVQHGVYTLNFVQPTWLPISARTMP